MSTILVLNPGSSTLKWSRHEGDDSTSSGTVDRPDSLGQAAETLLRDPLVSGGIVAVGCRVVHGGARFSEATTVTPDVLAEIRALGPLAPLHNPPAADVLDACLRTLPGVPIVAVFDTAFHQTLPPLARTYALPREICETHGLRRFGFHGIAHRQVSETLRGILAKQGAPASRLVTCHLGSGASLCAIRDGRSVDTSMGLTPLEGLVMATRSGDVDPGLLLFLLNHANLSPAQLDDLLNQQSGLKGVSDRSGDVRELEERAQNGDAPAQLALDLFAYRAAKTLGAYAVALEGLDAVAFSGGIGEHDDAMRVRICRRLAFLGLRLDAARNAAATTTGAPNAVCISADDSRIGVWVVPANENRQIARETRRAAALLTSEAAAGP